MISVFVLVDALGWELIKDRDLLRDVLPYQREVETVFGFSSAAIPSILTGMLPREHGHWNLFLYDPENSPFRFAKPLQLLPSSWINSRVVRKMVSIVGRKLSRSRGYFQIYGVPVEYLPMFDICEKEDIYSPGGMLPSQSIFDLLQEKRIPYKAYSYHEFKDSQAVEQAVSDLRSRQASFYFVYLSELDAFLHTHIHDTGRVDLELRKYASDIRTIYEAAAAVDPGMGFYVFSDHGMTQIRETFDLMGVVQSLGWRAPRDYLTLYDSTMARFWFFQEQARKDILAKLAGLGCGHVVTEEERKAFGIDFGHNRFGDAVFLMNEGCLMHPSHMGRVPWPGMHGFHPQDISSSAALLARRPPPIDIRHVRDMYQLMRHEAGLASG